MAKKKRVYVDGVEVVMTRQAAEIIGCSMTHMRSLGRKGTVPALYQMDRVTFFSLEDVKKYATSKRSARGKGHIRGVAPQGFSTS
jgi:hypothetical protein